MLRIIRYTVEPLFKGHSGTWHFVSFIQVNNVQNGKFSQNGKFGQNGMSGQKGKVHLGPYVSSSAHYRGCVVNGSGAMAAI